jgi:hypothetical protein
MEKPGLFYGLLISTLLQVISFIIGLNAFDPAFFGVGGIFTTIDLYFGIVGIFMLYLITLCLSQKDYVKITLRGGMIKPAYFSLIAAIYNVVWGILFIFHASSMNSLVTLFFILFILSGVIALYPTILDLKTGPPWKRG